MSDGSVTLNPITRNEEIIRRTIADLVASFVARDRDYAFPRTELENIIATGEITVKELAIMFYEELQKYFP